MAQVPDVATRWRIVALAIGLVLVANATASTYYLYFRGSPEQQAIDDLRARVKSLEEYKVRMESTEKARQFLIDKYLPPEVKRAVQ